MSFELMVSSQRDPLAAQSSNGSASPCESHATVALNGRFDEAASKAVLKAVADLSRDGAHSIVVEMQDVDLANEICLQGFADGLMAQRGNGVQVQVSARDARVHAQLAKAPDARDWLLDFDVTDTASARVAIHVDGLNSAG